MKKAMILAALCAAVLAGCGPKTPEAVAQKFLETAIMTGDFEAGKKYMSKDTVKDFEAYLEKQKKEMGEKKFKEMLEKEKQEAKKEAKGVKIEKKDVKVDGDKATVTFKLSKEGEKDTEEHKIKLIKEDGEWKVIKN